MEWTTHKLPHEFINSSVKAEISEAEREELRQYMAALLGLPITASFSQIEQKTEYLLMQLDGDQLSHK